MQNASTYESDNSPKNAGSNTGVTVRTKLYQIRDRISEETLGPVMPTPSNLAAIRSFTDIIKAPNTQLHEHPDDFELLFLGEQDTHTGEIFAVEPQVIMNGAAVIAQLEHNARVAAASAQQQNGANAAATLSFQEQEQQRLEGIRLGAELRKRMTENTE